MKRLQKRREARQKVASSMLYIEALVNELTSSRRSLYLAIDISAAVVQILRCKVFVPWYWILFHSRFYTQLFRVMGPLLMHKESVLIFKELSLDSWPPSISALYVKWVSSRMARPYIASRLDVKMGGRYIYLFIVGRRLVKQNVDSL